MTAGSKHLARMQRWGARYQKKCDLFYIRTDPIVAAACEKAKDNGWKPTVNVVKADHGKTCKDGTMINNHGIVPGKYVVHG